MLTGCEPTEVVDSTPSPTALAWAVPRVDLASVEDGPRARILAAQRRAEQAQGGRPDEEAAAIGELGALYLAYPYPTAAAECYRRAGQLEPETAVTHRAGSDSDNTWGLCPVWT